MHTKTIDSLSYFSIKIIFDFHNLKREKLENKRNKSKKQSKYNKKCYSFIRSIYSETDIYPVASFHGGVIFYYFFAFAFFFIYNWAQSESICSSSSLSSSSSLCGSCDFLVLLVVESSFTSNDFKNRLQNKFIGAMVWAWSTVNCVSNKNGKKWEERKIRKKNEKCYFNYWRLSVSKWQLHRLSTPPSKINGNITHSVEPIEWMKRTLFVWNVCMIHLLHPIFIKCARCINKIETLKSQYWKLIA